MTEIVINIERSSDGFYWGFSPDEKMITGGGASLQACKKDVLDCIDTLKELENPEYLSNPYKLIFKEI